MRIGSTEGIYTERVRSRRGNYGRKSERCALILMITTRTLRKETTYMNIPYHLVQTNGDFDSFLKAKDLPKGEKQTERERKANQTANV